MELKFTELERFCHNHDLRLETEYYSRGLYYHSIIVVGEGKHLKNLAEEFLEDVWYITENNRGKEFIEEDDGLCKLAIILAAMNEIDELGHNKIYSLGKCDKIEIIDDREDEEDTDE